MGLFFAVQKIAVENAAIAKGFCVFCGKGRVRRVTLVWALTDVVMPLAYASVVETVDETPKTVELSCREISGVNVPVFVD
jgi:hypothetical protein